MFNVGDIITGKDRSYKRSLYRILELMPDNYARLQFLCLGGRLGRQHEQMRRPLHEFRIADKLEIKEQYGLALSINLIDIVNTLIKPRHSAFNLKNFPW